MTVPEIIHTLELLLDDGRLTFPRIPEAVEAVNEAQYRKLKEYFRTDEQRALRLLYRKSDLVYDGAEISDNSQPVLYPSACRVYDTLLNAADPVDEFQSLMAEYIDPPREINLDEQVKFQRGNNFPRNAYYTVKYNFSAGRRRSTLHFARATTPLAPGTFPPWARLWYVVEPPRFSFDPLNDTNWQGLSVPREYQMDIVVLAAEILNDIDVLELERSQVAYQNQKTTIEGVTKIG